MTITVADIKAAVVAHFALSPIEMVSDRRARRYAQPRQIAMLLARDLTPHSYPFIGREFGNRDHTTVMHAVARIELLCRDDPQFRALVDGLRAGLEAEAERRAAA